MIYSQILGVGSALPRCTLSNDEISSEIDTTHDWIFSRTGISSRRIAVQGETATTLGLLAARRALEDASCMPEEIDYILSTGTPDSIIPNQAVLFQKELAIPSAPCLDIQAACSGFLYALDVADALIKSGRYRKILIVSSEIFSRSLDWSDRSTSVLFGDAAGAVVVSQSNEPKLLGISIGANSQYSDIMSLSYFLDRGLIQGSPYFQMKGSAVFKVAVHVVEQSIRLSLQKSQLTLADISWFVIHQANKRILSVIAEKLEVPLSSFALTMSQYGNTSSSSVPLALHSMRSSGQIQPNQFCVLAAMGGGMNWGSLVVKM